MRRRGVLGTIALFLVVVIMLGVIGGAVYMGIKTDWYTDWSIFSKTPDEGNEEKPGEGKEDNSVQDGDGAQLTSGEVYALPKALVYSAQTSQSSDAGDGIRVTATVTPSTATNKNVTWGVAFVNAESEWAIGKSVSDYFTAVPEEGTPNTVLLTCVEPFAEQIILTASSVEDPEKSASCTVDFRQKITKVSVNIGNVPVNLGGDTNVSVDITMRNTHQNEQGGRVTLNYELTDTYTIAEKISKTSVALSHGYGNVSGQREWLAYTLPLGAGRSSGINYDNDENALNKEIYFDLRFLELYNFHRFSSQMNGSDIQTFFHEMDTEELATYYIEQTHTYNNGEYIEPRQGTKLWDINVKIESENVGICYENSSALHWISCKGVNVTLDQGTIII